MALAYALILSSLIALKGVRSQRRCDAVFTEEKAIIESPNYPGHYPNNVNCSYFLKGPECAVNFTIHFLDFNLETSPGCVKDRLEIMDQDAVCGGRIGERTYSSRDGNLLLKFLSDGEGVSRGFRLLYLRSPCQVDQNTKTQWQPPPLPACCQSPYTSKRFQIASPGFPFDNDQPADCTYTINKANANVCRLRIHFLAFKIGVSDPRYGCAGGFLQIDGKRICGCRKGLKLIAPFNPGDPPTKTFRFKSEGRKGGGFLLEIVQDECPIRSINDAAEYQNDQINRAAWSNLGNQSVVAKARLIAEDTEILNDAKFGGETFVVKHIYVFEPPELYGINMERLDKEETNYIDTATIQGHLPFNGDDFGCTTWDSLRWQFQSEQLPKCKSTPTTSIGRKCVELNAARGFFQSPGYPYYYPPNLNLCYRFRKMPGHCAIRMFVQDFDLEDSYDCRKDYLQHGAYRYCGRRLLNTLSTFDMRNMQSEEINFSTDGYYCGRGFRVVYDQIPCPNLGYLPPTNPPPPTSPPPPSCDRVIREASFALEIPGGSNRPSCRFEILRSSPRVCLLILKFTLANMRCEIESLTIKGRQYCSRAAGETFYLDFYENSITVLYQKVFGADSPGPRLKIDAMQSENCQPPTAEVSPERQIKIDPEGADVETENRALKGDTDICGLVLETADTVRPETLCDALKVTQNLTECLPLSATSIYVPYNNNNKHKTLELKLMPPDMPKEVTFRRVRCNEIN